MYAVTIRQPYASMLAHGFRYVEIRSSPIPENKVGIRVAIHASAKPISQIALAKLVSDPGPSCLGINAGRARVMRRFMAKMWADYSAGGERKDNVVPYGAIIGTGVLNASYRLMPSGMWVWPFTEVRRIEIPVPAKGAMRIWWTDIGIPLRAGTIEAGSAPALLLKNKTKDLTRMIA